MRRVLADAGQRDLVGPVRSLDQLAVDLVWPGPALRGTQDDCRPCTSVVRLAAAGRTLDSPNIVVGAGESELQGREHLSRIVALDEDRCPTLTAEVVGNRLIGAAPEHCRAGDLGVVEMQNGQHCAVTNRVQERLDLPRTRQRTGFGLPVADDTGDHQIGIVERRARGVDQGIPQLAALVDTAGGLHAHMARNATGSGELATQTTHTVAVERDVGIDLAVRAFEIGVRDQRRATVTGTGDIQPIRTGSADEAIEQRVDHRQTGAGAPVPEQSGLDVFHRQWLP